MKNKIIISTVIVLANTFAFGQVGVNTNTPQSTLEVVGTTMATKADGVLVPRFTVAELSAKDTAYGASQNGVLVFVTSGAGAGGKTSDITGAGFYYYDNSTSKWKVVGGNSSTSFSVTADQTGDYTVLPTDSFIKLNIDTPGHTLTLPTSGITVGKVIYVSNIGLNNITISPAPRNTATTFVGGKGSGVLIYLGDGTWDWVSGF